MRGGLVLKHCSRHGRTPRRIEVLMTATAGHGNHVADFLAMLTAERGASQNTIEAYANDLEGFIAFLADRQVAPEAAVSSDIQTYIGALASAGQAPASRARRLSTVKQYYRFLAAEGLIKDDPTAGLHGPKKRRALPKVLSIAEVDTLLSAAEKRCERSEGRVLFRAVRLHCLLEMLYAT